MIEGNPCKVISISSAITSKHGHAKVNVEAVSILDGRKLRLVRPSGHPVDVPRVEKKTAQAISVSKDTAQLMDLQTYETFDITIPEEMRGKIFAGNEVSYWVVEGKKILKSLR